MKLVFLNLSNPDFQNIENWEFKKGTRKNRNQNQNREQKPLRIFPLKLENKVFEKAHGFKPKVRISDGHRER